MIGFLIEKEFKQIWRNKLIISVVALLPCLVMLVFPWATTMEIRNLRVVVIDHDRSTMSTSLTQKISSTEYFNVISAPLGMESGDALMEIEYGRADIVVDIPLDFERDLTLERKGVVQIIANAVNGTKASIGTSYLEAIILEFTSASAPIHIEPIYLFNPTMDYKIPMIPALIMLVIAIIVGFLPAMNIVSEKESGTIEQINVSPVPKMTFIIAKLIPYWVIGVVVLSLAVLVSWLMYSLVPAGSILLLYGVSMLFILGISGLGLIISNYSSTMQQAMFTIFFIVIIFILMCGVFTPIGSMPAWAQTIARFNPFTYYAQMMQMIYLKGSTIEDVMPQIGSLLIFFVGIFTWAILSYKKRD